MVGRVLAVVAIVAVAAGCGGGAGTVRRPTPHPRGTDATSTTLAPGQDARNLAATDHIRAELLTAFAGHKRFPESDFRGPVSGSLYYGYLASTKTYWAIARFGPAATAPFQVSVDMQDGGDIGVFSRRTGQPWTVKDGGLPFPCPYGGVPPQALLDLWGLSYSPACTVVDAQSPDRSDPSLVPSPNDLPAGTYFGLVLYFSLQLDGNGSMLFEPETWDGQSSPVSHRHTYFSIGIDPATTAGFWDGTTPVDAHEVVVRFDEAFATQLAKWMTSQRPPYGYRLTVARQPGCVGICATASMVETFTDLTPTGPFSFTEPL